MKLIYRAFFTLIFLLFIFLPATSSAQFNDALFRQQQQLMNDLSNKRQNKFREEFNKKAKMGQMMDSKLHHEMVIYNNPYAFEILFKDSTRKKTYSNIYFDTILRKSYLILEDKSFSKSDTAHRNQKIYPDQTLKISRINFSDKVINGIANDSCWMFKVLPGSINVYSYLSEENGPTFNAWTIIGIQQNDGPIIKYNPENLKQMVAQDSEALEKAQNKQYYMVIKIYNRNFKKAAKK
ncbi:MAG: hypothetical protein JWP78_4028 [Mucilaginibacter sp.]|nr:hypothetical protein [Mucilaginibacter sp.]